MEQPDLPPSLRALYQNDPLVRAALTHYLRGNVSLEAALIAAVETLAAHSHMLQAQLFATFQRTMPHRRTLTDAGGVVLSFWPEPTGQPWEELMPSHPALAGGPLDETVPVGAVLVQSSSAPPHEHGDVIVQRLAFQRGVDGAPAPTERSAPATALFRPLRGVLATFPPDWQSTPPPVLFTGWLRLS